MEILTIENLSFSYAGSGEKVLDDLSFSIEKGDFLTVCGATGCGKTTLLRLIKKEPAPLGEMSGKILINGFMQSEMTQYDSACKIGFVMQCPEQQLVTDKVWHELAFGLENLGIGRDEIRRRVCECACYFGIEDLFEKNVSELSGGEKQMLNLASVMVMRPSILILDEPTSQLDPISAENFIAKVAKLNSELTVSVVIAEHRLENVLPLSNKLLAIENGKAYAFGDTREAVSKLKNNSNLLMGMPSAVRLFANFEIDDDCPLSQKEGKTFIEKNFANNIKALPEDEYIHSDKPALEFSDVSFRYTKDGKDVLKGASFTVYDNEIFFIHGGNGSGKSTLLSLAAGLKRQYAGNIRIFGKKISEYKGGALYNSCLSMLPQDAETVFLRNTVRQELSLKEGEKPDFPIDLSDILQKHPYDISQGQKQLVALAVTLKTNPRILLLDEPTKGLDAVARKNVTDVLKGLKRKGTTIVCVTHDLEFASLCADRCAMLFNGEIISSATPRRFFSENSYYTTPESQMARGYYELVSDMGELCDICRTNGRRKI